MLEFYGSVLALNVNLAEFIIYTPIVELSKCIRYINIEKKKKKDFLAGSAAAFNVNGSVINVFKGWMVLVIVVLSEKASCNKYVSMKSPGLI